MRTCSKCLIEKPLSEYHKKTASPDGLKKQCKNCCSDYHKKMLKHPERVQVIRRAVDRRRLKLINLINEIKDKPCMDCGNRYPACAMDFDHRPGVIKLGNLSRISNLGWSPDRILAEIEKCDLVCANCHRVRTASRRKKPATSSTVEQSADNR